LAAPGELASEHIHTPGIYVKRMILATRNEKRIERRVLRKEEA
jgi:3-oxoacid CoA-transferase subunit A